MYGLIPVLQRLKFQFGPLLWVLNLMGNNAFRRGVQMNPLLNPPEWYNRYDCIIFFVLTNLYGHPHDEAIKRIESIGAIIYRTGVEGQILFNM